ncbi:UNVERIFIED_CONTAM: hypothetical protein RMT77_003695 [Armadillidium vulgare]
MPSTIKIKMIIKYWKLYALIFAPFIFAFLFCFSTSKETRCGYVILVMVLYWVTEAIPMAVTALIPIFAFPLLGVMSSSTVCHTYLNETTILLLGGLIFAVVVEHSNLHKRIALFVTLHVGQSPRKLLFGFMLTTTFLSMWISNIASTAMMVPIVDAVLKELYKSVDNKDLEPLRPDEREEETEDDYSQKNTFENSLPKYKENTCNPEEAHILYKEAFTVNVKEVKEEEEEKTGDCVDFKTLKTMYFLGVAYAANIGGIGTLTGAAPNLVLKDVLDTTFDQPTGLNYGTWMVYNIPGVVLSLLFSFIWLQFLFVGFGSRSKLPETTEEKRNKVKELIKTQYNNLGKISFHEMVVVVIFFIVVLLWLLREPGFMPGWADLVMMYFPHITVGDGVPAILATVFFFIIPSHPNFWPSLKYKDGPSEGCVIWRVVHEKVPWDIIFLLGGGFAMAKGCNDSGLSVSFGEKLRFIDSLPPSVGVLLISVSTAFATEVISNTAIASILVPILKELSLKTCINPLYLMISGTVSCSFSFMLPVATPPNAIVYGAAGGDMKTSVMMKAGWVMNVVCGFITTIMINTFGMVIFNVGELPSWVNSTSTQDYVQKCFTNLTVLELA